jgi:predicted RNase H-like HicB family nuclease
MQYAVIIEESQTGFGAYVPDLPGCVAVGETEEQVRELIREAMEFQTMGCAKMGNPFRRLPSASSMSRSSRRRSRILTPHR